jgi:hypothetical protein
MGREQNVRLQLNGSVQDVLARIRSATERESLPFISESRYPQQRAKEFVSHISGNQIRIWKVPSSTRRRQNISVPYFSGEIVPAHKECILRGHFALHPFSRILPLLPLAIGGPIWLWPDKTGHFFPIALSVTAVCFLTITILIAAVRRLRPQEEQDIVDFLKSLFPETQDSWTKLGTDGTFRNLSTNGN